MLDYDASLPGPGGLEVPAFLLEKMWNMHIKNRHVQKTQPPHTAKKKTKREHGLLNDQFQNRHQK
jgi:hypothetical protein